MHRYISWLNHFSRMYIRYISYAWGYWPQHWSVTAQPSWGTNEYRAADQSYQSNHGDYHQTHPPSLSWSCRMSGMSLTHWCRDKMAAISQTILSDSFSWMKMLKLRLKFHWSLFLRVQLTLFQHWFRLWLGAGQATSHYLNQWWLVYWRIYASLGLNELITRSYKRLDVVVNSLIYCIDNGGRLSTLKNSLTLMR